MSGGRARGGRRVIADALRRRRRALILGLLATAGYAASILVGPIIAMAAVDDVVAGRHGQRLPLYIGVVLVAGIGRAVFSGARKYFSALLATGVGNDLRSRMFDHLQRLSFSFHDRLGTGELISRASYDATTIEAAVNSIPFMVQAVVMAAVGVVLMTLLQPLLAAAVIALVVVCGVPAIVLALPMNRMAASVQDSVGRLTQFIEQSVNGIRVIKGHGLEEHRMGEARALTDGLYSATLPLVRRRALFVAAFVTTPVVAIFATVAAGEWLGSHRAMTPGALFAFIAYLALLVALIPVAIQAFSAWPQAVASAKRIDEVLSSEPEVRSPARPLRAGTAGGVRFESVTFGYITGSPVVANLDLDVSPGRSLALVGTSGSGKSTIAKLVPRFYDPWQGRVLLDGVDVRTLDLADLRRSVSIVFEETVTFSASIAANIALGRPSASRAEVEAAARLANAHEFVAELHDGYDTIVGEQGFTLSGGQRQRLAIARAILRESRFLILDDATSALDPGSQSRITGAVREFMRGRTALVIAHRPETISLADEVALIDGGRVVARGSHESLLGHTAYRQALGLDATSDAALRPAG